MKTVFNVLMLFLLFGMLAGCSQTALHKASENQSENQSNKGLIGKWIRIGFEGPMILEFKDDGEATIDFGGDGVVDVVSDWTTKGDTILFTDDEGKTCPDPGLYKFVQNDYYLGFDVIDDNCNGRIKKTMGYWAKPEFAEQVKKLDNEIDQGGNSELYLDRARIFLATGNPEKARSDLDSYIEVDSTNARVYLNRAGTRFPGDMAGAVMDCSKAIALEPGNKNAYFLRGLALYQLGDKEKACEDFTKAIELGFSILRIAEEERCSEFWGKSN